MALREQNIVVITHKKSKTNKGCDKQKIRTKKFLKHGLILSLVIMVDNKQIKNKILQFLLVKLDFILTFCPWAYSQLRYPKG
jgi:hypothetical protein